MKYLNVKLLIWLFVTPAILAVGVHFLHAYQVDRNSGSLLRQAEDAKRAGKVEDAISKYSQYLKNRDDGPSYNELANLVADVAEKPEATRNQIFRAFQVMEKTLQLHNDLSDVRRRAVEFCMKFGRFRDATDHIDRLRESDPESVKDVTLDVKYAQCLVAIGREEKAIKLLSDTIGFDSSKQEFRAEPARGAKQVDAYVLLAEVFRKHGEDSREADIVMEQLTKANPDSFKAFLERGRFHDRQKKYEEADKDLIQGLKLAPEDAEVLIAAAETAGALKDYDRAMGYLRTGVEKYPNDERMYRAMATLAQQQRKPEEAMKYVEDGLKHSPKSQYLLLFRADLELAKGDIDGVRATANSMREGGFLPELIDYIECRILVSEQKWTSASRALEKLRPLMARFPDLTMQVDMFLGQAYLSQSQPDRAMDAFRRALDADPSSIPAKLGYAQSLQSMGKANEAQQAITEVRGQLTENNDTGSISEAIRNNMLQYAIAEQMRKPKDERDWKPTDKLLAEVLKDDTLTEPQKAVLNAEIAMLKEEIDKARKVLADAVKKNPKELAVWLGLLNLVQQEKREGDTPERVAERAEKVLDRAEEKVGVKLQLRQARLNLAARKKGKEAKTSIAKLEKGLDDLGDKEQIAFLADLGNAYYRLKDYENARRCWLKVAQSRADDSKILQTLFELSQEFGDEAGMDATLDQIRKALGASSPLFNFCEAEKVVWQLKQKKAEPSALAAAKKSLEDARKARPEWHEISRLSGEIHELENKPDEAITDFQKALELGPPNPNIARRLVALLYLRGRINEVEKAMAYVGDVSSSDPLEKIRIEGNMRKGKLDDAVEDAAKVVAADPENANNHLWYGQLLARAGRDSEASNAFRAAVKQDPKLAQGWMMLIAHLANSKQLVDAQAVIREAKGAIAPEQRQAFLAQAYEIIGEKNLSEQNYRALLEKKPDDVNLMRGIAAFYLRTGEREKAVAELDKILARPASTDPKAKESDHANLVWARRAMAQTLADRGDYHGLQDALKQIEANRVDGKLAVEDMVLAAGMLTKRPEYASRMQARKLLEQVQSQRALGPEEQFILSQLYEQTGDYAKGRDLVTNVLSKAEGNVNLATTYVQMLLRHDDLLEADRWISKLETARPDSPVAMELRARLLSKQGKPQEAADLLVKFVDKAPNENSRMQMLGAVASMLEEFGQFDTAEQMIREVADSSPRAKLALGAFLGRHGSVDDAFALYEDSRKSQPLTNIIQASLETLRRRSLEVSKRQVSKVDGWIQTALQEDPTSLKLMLQQAELRDIQQHGEEVVSIYRQLLSRTDITPADRAIVDNNLAFVLGLSGKSSEAAEGLKLIDEAIQTLGPSSDLLDTRAVCYLATGDLKNAKEDLRAAIIDSPSPVKYMHLAMAESKFGDKSAATTALNKARDLKLDLNVLTARERDNYDQLAKQLEEK